MRDGYDYYYQIEVIGKGAIEFGVTEGKFTSSAMNVSCVAMHVDTSECRINIYLDKMFKYSVEGIEFDSTSVFFNRPIVDPSNTPCTVVSVDDEYDENIIDMFAKMRRIVPGYYDVMEFFDYSSSSSASSSVRRSSSVDGSLLLPLDSRIEKLYLLHNLMWLTRPTLPEYERFPDSVVTSIKGMDGKDLEDLSTKYGLDDICVEDKERCMFFILLRETKLKFEAKEKAVNELREMLRTI